MSGSAPEDGALPVGPPVALDLPRPRPARAPIPGRTMTLLPADPETQAAGLHAAFLEDRDHAGWTYLPYGPFADEDAFRRWMAETCLGDDPLFFTVEVAGAPVGVASYLRITPAAASIEIGHIHFAPALQRTPAATEALARMMEAAFALGYRRVEWKCDALNAPSRRAAARLGFTYEGTHRQATVVKGRNRDTAWYSVLDSEWPAVQAGFERWLAPANFDGQGRQHRRLEDCR